MGTVISSLTLFTPIRFVFSFKCSYKVPLCNTSGSKSKLSLSFKFVSFVRFSPILFVFQIYVNKRNQYSQLKKLFQDPKSHGRCMSGAMPYRRNILFNTFLNIRDHKFISNTVIFWEGNNWKQRPSPWRVRNPHKKYQVTVFKPGLFMVRIIKIKQSECNQLVLWNIH